MFKPRPAQLEVLNYEGGKMGVAAVPGSGKTATLAMLAAKLVAEKIQSENEEVLVVTLVNSAVNNVSARIDKMLGERGLLPRMGYHVRTLHGLSHDIVRERPGLVGLSEDFQILDERETTQILEEACEAWLKVHPEIPDIYTSPEVDEKKRASIRRKEWPQTTLDIVSAFIRQAKDQQLLPEVLAARLAGRENEFPLAHMAVDIYAYYQRALAYRGGVDFDDLNRLALDALRLDPEYLARLRKRWPYILEDEAQDSSALQERILSDLAGPNGNWVRVGDPNQAIFETFTTANPNFLRDFLAAPDVKSCQLPHSGRSCQKIIDLANYLVEWAINEHPEAERARAALCMQRILPTPPGDSQPNPPDTPTSVWIHRTGYTGDQEINAVVQSVKKWIAEHPTSTVAILVPINNRGFRMAEALRKEGIPHLELLQSTISTRDTADALAKVLCYLADPQSPSKLAEAFQAWQRGEWADEERKAQLKRIAKLLRSCRQVEDYLWPQLKRDWLSTLRLQDEEKEGLQLLAEFRDHVRRWHNAVLLPIDQLVLTLAGDLFREPAELALAYKLSLRLRVAANLHPTWRLPELNGELAMIARNESKFIGLSEEDTGFDPDKHPGTVVVTTIHKAKGLEWDRVYLTSVNNYDFPSAQSYDTYIAEKWFVREKLNLQAECLGQLDAITNGQLYVEGEPTQRARLAYVAERLRLLYVGITRARKELIITWNTGKPNRPQRMAIPLIALHAFWEANLKPAQAGPEE